MTTTILQTFIYPVKSLAGIACDSLDITDRGARGDRRWMLVDQNGRFISQREWPKLCLMSVGANNDGFQINDGDGGCAHLPFSIDHGRQISVTIWSDTVPAISASDEVNQFFSRVLDMSCTLVYMPDETKRFSDSVYAGSGQLNSFSDGYPLLLIGTASILELNGRLKDGGHPAIGWDRFRPNIVVETNEPHEEDYWAEFSMGEVKAKGVKLCSRCIMTTVDQTSGVLGKEPLRTLAQYRTMKNKIMFGQNVIAEQGMVRIGDAIRIGKLALPLNAES